MSRENYFNYIEQKINELATRINSRSRLNILDLNQHSESTYQNILNKLYSWNLENENENNPYTEAIDLIDHYNKLVIQISATNTKEKIEAALKKTIIEKYKNYTFKFVSISKDADNLLKQAFVNPYGINFLPNNDIYDKNRVLKKIKGIRDIDNLIELYHLVRKELREVIQFADNVTLQNLPPKIQYPTPLNYIQRTVSQSQNKADYYWGNIRKNLANLIEENNTKNKIVLLSIGGNGKSMELKYIAYYFSNNDSSIFPILINLRDASSNDKIEDLLQKECNNWKGIDDKSLLLLFDGLDEVNEVDYRKIIIKINNFCADKKGIRVIISSRTNHFYDLNGDNILNDYDTHYLNSLTQSEIVEYANLHLDTNAVIFLNKIENLKLYDILSSPFYLSHLVEICKSISSINDLPKSKAKLIELILEKEKEVSNKKFAGNKNLRNKK